MKVIYGLDHLRLSASVVTSGTFDGVHLGHKSILQTLTRRASEINALSVVITFHPHPRIVLKKNPESLTLLNTLDERIRLIETTHIDVLCVAEFSEAFSRLSYSEYLHLLRERTGLRHLVAGYDHHFGHNREGGPEKVQALCRELGIGFEEVPAVVVNGTQVSSTKIRQALTEGRVSEARAMLGYPYPLGGKVVRGDGLGRRLGFPTANIVPDDPLKLIPAEGIYAVQVSGQGFQSTGMAYIGRRPTLPNNQRQIEVHIFDFNKDLYEQSLTLHFLNFVRNDRKFSSLDELARALQHDALTVKALLGA